MECWQWNRKKKASLTGCTGCILQKCVIGKLIWKQTAAAIHWRRNKFLLNRTGTYIRLLKITAETKLSS